ncbi:uncharacterized protein N7515_006452 [Penicillium bovifimosum]|uniref:CFEM domain-containing protein n=1 Tax=Penicillium bovifimosum TaxID=126998 RepID=A0A9W9KZR9_9EURO|nr:uncharacterized protein N7515_006452 [Penicillium bovifimosum]KAJ5130413.1 hypothetical protein N7515_006452 [Penicillium bovifimosum]
MLVHPVHRIIIAILLSLALCSAADEIPSNVSNEALYEMVPDCAKDCVDNFIRSEYSPTECTSSSDIMCLCRSKTTSSLTLGEAALSCVMSICPQAIIRKSEAYHICDLVSEALPKTHQTITATVFSDTRTTKTNDAKATDFTTSASTTSSSKYTTPTTSSQTSEITTYDPSSSESRVEPTPTGESDPPPVDSSEDTEKKHDNHISPAAIIGMSVASGLAGSFIIGVAVFFCCKRWRRKHREETAPHSFEIGGAMSEPSDFSNPMPRPPTDGLGLGSSHSLARGNGEMSQRPQTYQTMNTVESASRYSPHFATVSHPGQDREPDDQERIGCAVSSESDWETSPRTQSSQRSVSRLLPDSNAGLYPKPLKWTHRPPSGETLFEEDEGQQAAAVAAAVAALATGTTQNNSPKPADQPKFAGLPANPRAFKKGFNARYYKQESEHPSTLASPFNPNAAVRASPPNNTSVNSQPSESPQTTHPSSTSTLLTAPIMTNQDQNQNRRLSPERPAPQPPLASSSTLPPGSEIVSRPRIVHGNDIKRVQIRGSPRQPSEVVVPYCPDDLWLERNRALAPPRSREPSGELPYPSDLCPGAVHYPDSPKKQAATVSNRVSPTSRNLTPSRRGEDLILRVD